MSAREIIASECAGLAKRKYVFDADDEAADTIIEGLKEHGYRILAPGELPSPCSASVKDGVVTLAYNSDEEAQMAFRSLSPTEGE